MDVDPDVAAKWLQVSTDILFELTGRQFPGIHTDTVRPCSQLGPVAAAPWVAGLPGMPAANRGAWGFCGCNRMRSCGCYRLSEIRLPGFPVVDITEVRVDGVVLDAAEYRVDDRRYLVRLPDENGDPQGWPCCQRLDQPVTDQHTFQIVYRYGTAAPAGGTASAAVLACEYLLACSPDTSEQCRLPRGTTNVNRQGLAITVLDPEALIKLGATGIPEVDLWVMSIMLGRSRRRATAFRTGGSRPVRRTS
jgi:hypothetical protein